MTLEPLNPPRVVHHMGALDSSGYPPNSLEAIRVCLDANADVIEIDVNALAEDDYLVLHGPDLSEETTAAGSAGQYTVESARSIFFKPDGTHRVPLLSEVVALLTAHPAKTPLQLDFKNVLPMRTDEPLERLVRLIEPLGERVIVSTGADWHLRRLRRLAPWLRLGFDIHFYIDWRPPDYVPSDDPFRNPPPYRKGAYGYWDDHMLAGAPLWDLPRYLDERIEAIIAQVPGVETAYLSDDFILHALADGAHPVEVLHRAGVRCDAWTLDLRTPHDLEVLKTLRACGVDLFTSNTPLALKSALAEESTT